MAEHKTILAVDDDPIILDSVADVVRLAGYHTLTAINGRDALRVMGEHRPDLIVADVTMPEMDGFEFYQAVRQNPDWLPIPFIFLTARGERRDIRQGLSLGADQYITKPFEPEDLLVAIDSRLKRLADLNAASEESVEQTKKQLLNVFSHELRTPLSTIYAAIGLLQEEQGSLDPDTMASVLHMMQASSDRLVGLVEDLLLLVSIETGVTALEIAQFKKPIDLSYEIQQAVRELSVAAESDSIRVTLLVPSELMVIGVAPYAHSVVRRLIDNAIRFSKKDGGEVRVTARADEDQGLAVVTVEDEGIGIAADKLDGLFEPLHQVDRERMEQQGAGNSLAIASSLVRLHGGTLSVESRPGEGSAFTFTLPLHLPVR